jgi:hypothetical protein
VLAAQPELNRASGKTVNDLRQWSVLSVCVGRNKRSALRRMGVDGNGIEGQGKRQEAYELLAPVYNWFTEGFDTKDLKDAKALRDDLEVTA